LSASASAIPVPFQVVPHVTDTTRNGGGAHQERGEGGKRANDEANHECQQRMSSTSHTSTRDEAGRTCRTSLSQHAARVNIERANKKNAKRQYSTLTPLVGTLTSVGYQPLPCLSGASVFSHFAHLGDDQREQGSRARAGAWAWAWISALTPLSASVLGTARASALDRSRSLLRHLCLGAWRMDIHSRIG
jgi:hypothetical protein